MVFQLYLEKLINKPNIIYSYFYSERIFTIGICFKPSKCNLI